MTRLAKVIFAAAMLWGSGNALAQYAIVPADQVFRTDQERYGHLEYFGFYASAMGHWNFTEELALFTNLTWIHVGSADDEPAAVEAMLERLLPTYRSYHARMSRCFRICTGMTR